MYTRYCTTIVCTHVVDREFKTAAAMPLFGAVKSVALRLTLRLSALAGYLNIQL